METLQTNKATVILDDYGRWVTGYRKEAPTVGNPHVGAKYFDTDNQKEYYWFGSAWTEVLSNPNFNDGYWDDLRFPASGFNPAGSTAPPTVDTATGLLTFSGTADNIIGGVAQMPHAWKRGSDIYPHVHVIATSSNAGKASRWKLEYNLGNNNEAMANNYGSYSAGGTITIDNPAAANTILLPTGWNPITMTGYRESSFMLWRISRLAASDAADNDTSDWVLVEFDIHYQIEKSGTLDRTPV